MIPTLVNISKYPACNEWQQLMKRATMQGESLHDIVADIIANVKANGDAALIGYAEKFDHVTLSTLKVSADEISTAEALLPDELKLAIRNAAENIATFHRAQQMQPIEVTTTQGVTCMQRAVPIERVGLYIPGGNAPLFSTVLMLTIPAKIAGCKEIILTTPPDRQGNIHPAILYAAHIAGATAIYKTGGAQAIAAMAHGTQSIPKVHKIFGPGNRFVTEAKKMVSADGVAIDMPAGPSEVMIIADENANTDFIAADFLSQAEHGPDSQSILLTTSSTIIERFPKSLQSMLNRLPHQDMILKSLSHSHVILLNDIDKVWEFANEYAPEHLIVNTANPDEAFSRVINAGSVFLGEYSPESAGDYASGTNHTLPTSGYAHCYSGVNLDSFIKKITFQRLSREGLSNIANTVTTMARNEHLEAHSLAVEVRIEQR